MQPVAFVCDILTIHSGKVGARRLRGWAAAGYVGRYTWVYQPG